MRLREDSPVAPLDCTGECLKHGTNASLIAACFLVPGGAGTDPASIAPDCGHVNASFQSLERAEWRAFSAFSQHPLSKISDPTSTIESARCARGPRSADSPSRIFNGSFTQLANNGLMAEGKG
jgi:hypothetical protein